MAAILGAHRVVVTDKEDSTTTLNNCQLNCNLNAALYPGHPPQVMGLTWGVFRGEALQLCHSADCVLGADVLYDEQGTHMHPV